MSKYAANIGADVGPTLLRYANDVNKSFAQIDAQQRGTDPRALTAQWTSATTTYKLFYGNATDTASADDSKLIDLQTNGVSQFSVDKNGVVVAGDVASTGTLQAGSATAPEPGGTLFFLFGQASDVIGFYAGTGDPTVSAGKGSFYSKIDATTASDRLWVNTDGGTTWTFVPTNA